MPGDMRDDVGGDFFGDEDVAALVRAPEREVEEEGAVPPAAELLRQDPEAVVAEDVLQIAVESDMTERALVLDDELLQAALDELGRGVQGRDQITVRAPRQGPQPAR